MLISKMDLISFVALTSIKWAKKRQKRLDYINSNHFPDLPMKQNPHPRLHSDLDVC